jgi:hypothetical protein
MHFDVIVQTDTPQEKAIEYGKKYLESVGEGDQRMTQEECQFCHIQEAPENLQLEGITFNKWKVVQPNIFIHTPNVDM